MSVVTLSALGVSAVFKISFLLLLYNSSLAFITYDLGSFPVDSSNSNYGSQVEFQLKFTASPSLKGGDFLCKNIFSVPAFLRSPEPLHSWKSHCYLHKLSSEVFISLHRSFYHAMALSES